MKKLEMLDNYVMQKYEDNEAYLKATEKYFEDLLKKKDAQAIKYEADYREELRTRNNVYFEIHLEIMKLMLK